LSETAFVKQLILKFSRGAVRLFRQNTAMAWVGEVVNRTPDTLTLRNPRPLHAGLCRGSSDLIGWQSVTITPDMVGQTVALFVALEAKTAKGVASDDQRQFVDVVNRAGGRAGIVRSDSDVEAVLGIQPTPGSRKD
jgi:hypothetical protein